jgi:hypothetical protein
MDSPNNIQSPTVSATPEQIFHEASTPFARMAHTDTSDTFEDTPVAKLDISPPHLVVPGNGYGRIPKPDSITTATLHSETDNGEMELASPIFSHGARYPALDGDVSEDMMEGMEQTSNSGSEVADNGNGGEMTRVLAPSVEITPNLSRGVLDSESRVQIEWIGTSTFFLEHNLELQEKVSFFKKTDGKSLTRILGTSG